MNKCAFTICTNSYIGIAETLRDSFLKHNQSYDFFIVVADDEEKSEKEYICAAKTAMNLSEEKYYEMAFKYNVTEFCTSIKPFAFQYFLNAGFELAIFLDPDIMVYSSFDELETHTASIYLTPHITEIEPRIKNEWPQEFFLRFGVFNCGFIAFRNDDEAQKILHWWGEKLKDFSFSDTDTGIYTDQKWIELLSGFSDIGQVYIIKNLGYDVAPWNFSERYIMNENNHLSVLDRETMKTKHELCFVHYSTFNYKKLITSNEIVSRDKITFIPEDILQLIEGYKNELIKHNVLNNINKKYLYNFYDNGQLITPLHRRLYRAALDENFSFGLPFATKENSFYSLMVSSKIIRGGQNNDNNFTTDNKPDDNDLKIKFMKWLLRLAFKLLKPDKYLMLLKGFRKFSRIENNLFLFKETELKKYASEFKVK